MRRATTKAQTIHSQIKTIIGVQAGISFSLEKATGGEGRGQQGYDLGFNLKQLHHDNDRPLLAVDRLGLGVVPLLEMMYRQRGANTMAQMIRGQVGTIIGVQAGMYLSLENRLT